MDSTAFKYNNHQQRQQNHQISRRNSNNINGIINDNHKNQNPIFILNTTTNNCLPNNPEFYYSDLNDNNVASLSSSSTTASSSSSSSSSVWSSASSTMCSPAAHAIQKLFNYSSNSLKLNHGNCGGIESKTFKTKSEILKKKSKFWKYLEGEANDKNHHQHQRGIENDEKLSTKSFKYKTNYWSKSYESDNQNQHDLSKLLEYSCSLCDNCRCIDCQIGYFDCENSDDSNSEYSFHLSAYEEDEEADDSDNENFIGHHHTLPLKTSSDVHENGNIEPHTVRKLEMTNCCSAAAYCVCEELNCSQMKSQYCQQCFVVEEECIEGVAEEGEFVTPPPHH